MTEGKFPTGAPSGTSHSPLNAGQSLWLSCVDVLAQELPEQQFNTWIKPLVAEAADDFSKLTIFVANRFKLDWVRAQYSGRITQLLEKMYGAPIPLELVLAPREQPVKSNTVSAFAENLSNAEPAGLGEDAAPVVHKHRLNSALTFDTLVEGTANRIGLTALGDTAALHQLIDAGVFDSAQVVYNMLNPSAADALPATVSTGSTAPTPLARNWRRERALMSMGSSSEIRISGLRVLMGPEPSNS